MSLNILRAFLDSVWPRRPARITYHRGYSTDTTGIPMIAARGDDDDVSIRTFHGTSIPDTKDTKTTIFGLSRLVQRLRQRFIGWRSGVMSFAICSSIVFLINFVFTVWGLSTYSTNKGALMDGRDCDDIKKINTGLHVVINVFSTILLSGSNYCMQCLSAPTREDIDGAHAKGKWLDIGIPSFRNLAHISRKRLCLWLLLGASSLPLHLL
jgi:hypothetical protein